MHSRIAISKWDLLILIPFFLLVAFPFLSVIINGIPFDTKIDTVYLNGLITASGIIFGFLSATAIAKSETLGYGIMMLISFDLVLLVMAGYKVFISALEGKPTVSTLCWTMSSFLGNSGTAWILMKKLRHKEV